ncbi:MAG TPA: NAD(P)/FAD-dependent oxidoreductase [Candidatus Saccharimonadales bacterium]|nr:NAD(P)/FAD-dependent oxidoreductase [Candidatus Saccharimonadales bacterium]
MRIVIAGGGFGGIKTALELAHHKEFDITLISDRDHFLYYPALYGTATGGSHLQSWVPLTTIFAHVPNVKVVKDTVQALDAPRKLLTGASGTAYEYDNCVLALGVVTTYFGIEGLAEHTYSIKSIEEVDRFKKHMHDEIVTTKHMDKNYVVVGAGPTGVELSAALTSYLTRVSDKHGIANGKIHIDLVEAAPRVLPKMSQKTSAIVQRRLEKLGVRVMTNEKVEAADDDSLQVNGREIPSKTVVWTSGVTNNSFFKDNAHAFHLAKNGRVEVDSHLQATDHVYVIGDNAATPFTGLAQTALHDALFISDHLRRLARKLPFRDYKARNPPVVVPVGEHWAIFEWGWLRLHGRIASLVRRAADFIGYSDVLPIGQALGVWRAEYKREGDCPTCR